MVISSLPAVLIEGKDVALVLYAGHTAVVLVFRCKDLVKHVLRLASFICVLRSVVPE